MDTQTALYSTPPINVRGTLWRFALDAETGRGGYQWQRHQDSRWLPLSVYPHRVLGLMTLAYLDRAIYDQHRDQIAAARQARDAMPREFGLAPAPSTLQFRLI